MTNYTEDGLDKILKKDLISIIFSQQRKSDQDNIGWLYVLIMSRTHFRVNPHSIVAWMSRNSLLEAGAKSKG